MQLEQIVDVASLPEDPWNDGELLWYLYRELGWSQRTIAYELGVEKHKVLRGLIENNVLQPWTDPDMLENALDAHQTPAGIADAWNCSELTIRRWLDEHGLKGRAELTADLLRELYEEQLLTTKEIADDLGYAPVEVQMAIREHDIDRREGTHRFE